MPPQHQMESHKSQPHAHPRESINSVTVLRVKTLWRAPGPPRVQRAKAACEPQAHNSPVLSMTESLLNALIYLWVNHRGETHAMHFLFSYGQWWWWIVWKRSAETNQMSRLRLCETKKSRDSRRQGQGGWDKVFFKLFIGLFLPIPDDWVFAHSRME